MIVPNYITETGFKLRKVGQLYKSRWRQKGLLYQHLQSTTTRKKAGQAAAENDGIDKGLSGLINSIERHVIRPLRMWAHSKMCMVGSEEWSGADWCRTLHVTFILERQHLCLHNDLSPPLSPFTRSANAVYLELVDSTRILRPP